jgi:hypothetical protein
MAEIGNAHAFAEWGRLWVKLWWNGKNITNSPMEPTTYYIFSLGKIQYRSFLSYYHRDLKKTSSYEN